MKTTERFDRAVTKLYNAFHEGRLDYFDCAACAVGNMCDGESGWAKTGDRNRSLHRNAIDKKYQLMTGYSSVELANIEAIFMFGHSWFPIKNVKDWRGFTYDEKHNKEFQFKALCAVVEYLCELDGIPNVMDYTKLFEYDKELNPIHEL